MKCNVCGADMISTTGGNYHCPKCGFAVNDLVYRLQSCDMPLPQSFGVQYGWICPRCGKVNSPDTRSCDCSGDATVYAYGGTVTKEYKVAPDHISTTTNDNSVVKFDSYTTARNNK